MRKNVRDIMWSWSCGLWMFFFFMNYLCILSVVMVVIGNVMIIVVVWDFKCGDEFMVVYFDIFCLL